MSACDDGPATPRVGPAAVLDIIGGDLQSGVVGTQLANPLVVRVTDADGQPVPGQVINFRVVSGGGSVFAGAAQTNGNGTAQELWTLGTVAGDTQHVEVRAVDATTGTPLVFATFRAVATAAAPSKLERASADGLQAEVATSVSPAPRVRVTDQYDNPVSGVTITFTPTSGGGSVTGATQTTDASGAATVGAWTLGSATGTNTMAATTSVLPAISVTFTASGLPAAATQIVIDQPASGARAGAAFAQQPRLLLQDAHGNIVTNATQPVTISASAGGALLGTTTVTPASGVASFMDAGLGGLVGAYDLTYHVTLSGVMRTTSQPITLSAGPAAGLAIQQAAAGASGGLPFSTQPAARVVDAFGNFVNDAALPVTLRVSASGAVFGDSTVSAVNGVAPFSNVGLDARAGAYTLSFNTSIGGDTRSVTQPITVSPGTPTRYLISANAPSVEVGVPVTITAQLADVDGNPVAWADQTITWSSTGTAGRFASATSTTNSAGVVTVVFTPDTIQTAASATVIATDARTRAGSVAVSVVPGAAAQLAFVSIPINAGYGVRMSDVRVAVQDRYGNTRTDDTPQIEVALGNNPGGATLSGNTSAQAAAGIGSFSDLVLNRDGNGYTLIATSAGLQSATSAAFGVSPVGVLVASTQDAVFSLGYALGYVYYHTRAGSSAPNYLMRVAPTGGTPSIHLSSGCCRGGAWVSGDDSHMFIFTHDGSATSPDYTVSGMGVSFGAPGSMRGFAYDGQYAYVAAGTEHIMETRLFRLRPAARDTLLYSAIPVGPIAAENGTVYLVQDDTIKAMPSSGGTLTPIAPNVTQVRAMLVANGTIYVARDNMISTVPTSGGTLTTRVTGVIDFSSMVIDGDALYVFAGGVLRRYDVTTFTPTTIVDSSEGIRAFALDSESVYWTSNTSPVFPFGGTVIKKKRK